MKERLEGWIKEKIGVGSFWASIFVSIYKICNRKPWSMGYNLYKFKLIIEVVNFRLSYFREGKLPKDYGYALDERIVEYPWVFSRIKEAERKILDAGATLNHGEILNLQCLKDKKMYIATLAYEQYYEVLPNAPSYIFEDLRDLSLSDESFDAIICISTLEHIGMDNTLLYTTDVRKNENDQYAYLTAIKEFRRILKKGGTLYLTVPYGRYKNHRWLQIFDAQMISLIKKEFKPSQEFEFYFKYNKKQWNYANAKDCDNAEFFDIHKESCLRTDYLASSESVACLELVK